MSRSPFAIALALAACGGDPGGFDFPENTSEAVSTYAAGVEASYGDSLDAALGLLLASPSQSTLDTARQAWLDSRVPYLQTEVFRFYDGPIDNSDDGPEGLLNAWPLDENYVDGSPDTGIVNGSDAIDGSLLESLNEAGGEKNIATGYHAIEFLLWGQDVSDSGPGERPYTDYVTDGTGTAANQDRRATYLTTSSSLLLTHLQQVYDAWGPGATYRADFEAVPDDSFGAILTGMIVLSGFETGGERLQAALDSGDREDEHSCFSDNTHADMVEDVRGIQNVCPGGPDRGRVPVLRAVHPRSRVT